MGSVGATFQSSASSLVTSSRCTPNSSMSAWRSRAETNRPHMPHIPTGKSSREVAGMRQIITGMTFGQTRSAVRQPLQSRYAMRHGTTGATALSPRSSHADLDEDDIRVRPGKGTRPRTRRRPAHAGAPEGFVTSIDRGRYGCLTDGRTITAMKARELGRRSVAVGDRVVLAGDVSGDPGTLARIVRIQPRTSTLRRSADDTDPIERVIVANAEQLVIVCALASPPPRLRFVDRCLVAAYDGGLEPLLVLTKADLASPRQGRAFYTPLGLPMLTTRRPLAPRTLSQVRKVLDGRIS